jgi:isopenicillin N synthase-like dioxygenase
MRPSTRTGDLQFATALRTAVNLPGSPHSYHSYSDSAPETDGNATCKGYNQWPSEETLPGFREANEVYVDKMLVLASRPLPAIPNKFNFLSFQALGNDVMRCMALSLELEETYFESFYNESFWVMRLIRYPPTHSIPETKDGLGCGEHCDYGCLTFVNQPSDPEGCLEVQSVDGSWIPADNSACGVDDSDSVLVVNIGDMLSLWTNGLYKSTPHRVVRPRPGAGERISVPFFFEPNYDALIEPLPHLGEPKFGPKVYGEHLLAKNKSNFNLPPASSAS